MKPVQRYFFLGDDWVYYKLYIGPRVLDEFLINTLKPLIQGALDEHIIDKWFFVNYQDDDRHIRLRFRFKNTSRDLNYWVRTLHREIKPLVEKRLIHKVQTDTYKRELERYGECTIEETESLFYYNSDLILSIIEETLDDDSKRWLWGLKAIDVFLDAWRLGLVEKRDFFARLETAFGAEMQATTYVDRQLSKKYRLQKESIASIIESADGELTPFLKTYLRNIQSPIESIAEKKKNGLVNLEIDELIGSFVHMHCNRLFKSNPRKNEWVLYYFLHQFYRSQAARLTSN